MKVIDLLIEIEKGNIKKLPKRIRYEGEIYTHKYAEVTYYKEKECVSDTLMIDTCYLNKKIEILDEEDEFIDIEHYDLVDNDTLTWGAELIANNFYHINEKLDNLVKNQKKIIERLSNE